MVKASIRNIGIPGFSRKCLVGPPNFAQYKAFTSFASLKSDSDQNIYRKDQKDFSKEPPKSAPILRHDPSVEGPFSSYGLDFHAMAKMFDEIPSITSPTIAQRTILSALNSSISIISRFPQGSGRSLALVLYVLNMSVFKGFIRAIILVPTDYLLKQYDIEYSKLLHKRALFLYDPDKSPNNSPLSIGEKPPHVVLTTPQTLLSYILKNPSLIEQFQAVQFVGVDEADYSLFDKSQRLYVGEKKRHTSVLEILLSFIDKARTRLSNQTKVSPLHSSFISSYDTSTSLKKKIVLSELDKRPLMTMGSPTTDNNVPLGLSSTGQKISTHIIKVERVEVISSKGITKKKTQLENTVITNIPTGISALGFLNYGDEIDFDRDYDMYRSKRLKDVSQVKIPAYMALALSRVLKRIETARSSKNIPTQTQEVVINDTVKTNEVATLEKKSKVDAAESKQDTSGQGDPVLIILPHGISLSRFGESLASKDDIQIDILDYYEKVHLLNSTSTITQAKDKSSEKKSSIIPTQATDNIEVGSAKEIVSEGAAVCELEFSTSPIQATDNIEVGSVKEIVSELGIEDIVASKHKPTESNVEQVQEPKADKPDSESIDSNSQEIKPANKTRYILAHPSSVIGLTFKNLSNIICVGIDSIPSSYYFTTICGRFRDSKGYTDSTNPTKIENKLILLLSASDHSLLEDHHIGRMLVRAGVSEVNSLVTVKGDTKISLNGIDFNPNFGKLKSVMRFHG